MINRIASALCNCRFESTYSTTEESVYQYLLDIILNCIRCDAGIDLTKKRAWTIIDTVYNMAFKWSVTPVLVYNRDDVIATSEVGSQYVDTYHINSVLSLTSSREFQL